MDLEEERQEEEPSQEATPAADPRLVLAASPSPEPAALPLSHHLESSDADTDTDDDEPATPSGSRKGLERSLPVTPTPSLSASEPPVDAVMAVVAAETSNRLSRLGRLAAGNSWRRRRLPTRWRCANWNGPATC